MADYTLFTTAELVTELGKYTSAYSIIYIKHDEDIGPKAIRTNINCYETAKMQVPGLIAKSYGWLKSRLKQIPSQKPPESESDPIPVTNETGKEILNALKNRTGAGVAAVVFIENHEVYMLNWESTKGQSMGLITELYERMME